MPDFYYKTSKPKFLKNFDDFFDKQSEILNDAQELAEDIGANYPTFTGSWRTGYKLTHFKFNEEPDLRIWIPGNKRVSYSYQLRKKPYEDATLEQIHQWKDIKSKLVDVEKLQYHYDDLSKSIGLPQGLSCEIFMHDDGAWVYCNSSVLISSPGWLEIVGSEYLAASKEMKNC